ncbi:Gfo/Idh/MocA family protein [Alloscardovia venturai]|uniref:Gfo/Idh/MocA family protein n=1 Tax=Alloscardovia venturai TaxID=1769421 RepID=A0ABW2Y435_9BIFI
MTYTTNIAILGAGHIAQKMATTIIDMENDERWSGKVNLYAVATHDSQDRADEFAGHFGIDNAFGTYAALLDDPEVDLVYVATPHAMHAQQAIACMEAGKHVLVEKAFTANAEQARAVISKSKETGLTCVEAIWTRFLPTRHLINAIINSGKIGEIVSISANLSYPMAHKERLVKSELAGGALLDVGVYPLNFIAMATDNADIDHIVTSARLSSQGVDEISQSTFWLDDGIMASMTTSYHEVGDRCGFIRGTRGLIRVENINNPEKIMVLDKNYVVVEEVDIPGQLTGFEYEVDATIKAIAHGDIETQEMPHSETLRIMTICDELREKWGMVYPFEK